MAPAASMRQSSLARGWNREQSGMMRVTQPFAAAIAIAIAALIPAGAQPRNSSALQRFNQAIAAYMAMRQDVVNRVGVPYVSSDVTSSEAMQAALARGI